VNNQNNISKMKFFLISAICFLSYAITLNAQLIDRNSIDSSIAKMNGYWYCQETAQYHIQYPKLTSIPPLHTDMSLEVLLAYIYADSLMRSVSRDDFHEKMSYWKNVHIKNDTIIGFIKYFYMMQDYNPIILNQYKACPKQKIYNFNAYSLYGVLELLDAITLNQPYYKSLYFIQRPDYILRVKVNSIDSSLSIDTNDRPDRMYYFVNASVIDTLKGRVFKNCHQNYNNKIKPNSILENEPEICFIYVDGPYWHDENDKIDPALLNYKGNLTLKPGQDLIVTLDHGSPLFDYDYDYFRIHFITALPIINDQVKDINHIWSDSTFLNYEDWKIIFTQRKQMLLDGGY
jgi:hypothetical protein